MSEPKITTRREGRVFVIGLNRPQKMNAFDREMLRELARAFDTFEADPDLWCAVIVAMGPNTTTGLDLADVGPAVRDGEQLIETDGVDPLGLRPPYRTKPVVMAARGWCLTIGLELMLACDIRIAAKDTKFSQLEVKRGIFPFGGGTFRLPQIAGWGNAMRWLLTGDVFDADEALRIGVICEVVDEDALDARAIELAQAVCGAAPLAVRAILTNAREAVHVSPQAAADQLLGEVRKVMDSHDAHEGLQSFLERRDARFEGR